MKAEKAVNPTKNTFLANPNIFIYTMSFFHQITVNIFNIVNISSIIIYTKLIDISIKACFFIFSADQSFEIFPKHNGVVTISESFALNL